MVVFLRFTVRFRRIFYDKRDSMCHIVPNIQHEHWTRTAWTLLSMKRILKIVVGISLWKYKVQTNMKPKSRPSNLAIACTKEHSRYRIYWMSSLKSYSHFISWFFAISIKRWRNRIHTMVLTRNRHRFFFSLFIDTAEQKFFLQFQYTSRHGNARFLMLSEEQKNIHDRILRQNENEQNLFMCTHKETF